MPQSPDRPIVNASPTDSQHPEQTSKLSRRDFVRLAAGMGAIPMATLAGNPVGPSGNGSEVLDVAIIGAGISGLTTARDLKKAGCESFVVLEARDRVGGRTYNHDLGGGRFSEGGGQWIGPGQTAVADLARELGVGTFPTYYQGKTVFLAGDARVATDMGGGLNVDPKLVKELEELARTVPSSEPWNAPRAAELDAMSFADWLAPKNLRPEDQLSWMLAAELAGGTNPAKLSLLHYLSMINSAGSYEGLEGIKDGAQELRLQGGSQILSLKMAESLGSKLRLSSPVVRISDWDKGPVKIQTAGGEVRARHVVVALSPGLCNQIAFDPVLPNLRHQLQERWPLYAPAMKTVHVYSTPFWRKKGYNGWVITLDGPLLWGYDNSPADESLGVINGFVLQSMMPTDDKAAEATLSALYAKALGEEALHPIGYHWLDWGRERWTVSCLSPIPPRFLTTFGSALRQSVGRLIWSGTETAEIWAGYMDGGVRAGHRAALQVLAAADKP